MFDVATGWKISVDRADTAGPYIIVPWAQIDALCKLLSAHDIPHAVEGEVPEFHHQLAFAEPVIRLDRTTDPDHVQDLLDGQP